MTQRSPSRSNRAALVPFLEALSARSAALRRDEAGNWRIRGSKGHVYAIPGGFQIMLTGWTAMGWNAAKRAMSFARVTQDGDGDGALVLDGLPTAEEAGVIRHYCGITKKRILSEEQLARLQSYAAEHRFKPKKPALDDKAGQ